MNTAKGFNSYHVKQDKHKITHLPLNQYEVERNKLTYTLGIYLSIITFFVVFVGAGCWLADWVVTL